MEEVAAEKALEWAANYSCTGAAIVTDSQSMLKKIEQGMLKPEWIKSIMKSKLKVLTWIFTPGHSGVKGNEKADELAGSAQITTSLQMGQKEVITSLQMEDERTSHTSENITRLKSFRVKRGDGAKEHLRGKSRRLKNQHQVGIISKGTLKEILEKRAEHVWGCPECNDANTTTK